MEAEQPEDADEAVAPGPLHGSARPSKALLAVLSLLFVAWSNASLTGAPPQEAAQHAPCMAPVHVRLFCWLEPCRHGGPLLVM